MLLGTGASKNIPKPLMRSVKLAIGTMEVGSNYVGASKSSQKLSQPSGED